MSNIKHDTIIDKIERDLDNHKTFNVDGYDEDDEDYSEKEENSVADD